MSEPKSLTEQSRDLEKRLNAIPTAILEALRPALMRSGEEVARNMRALVPEDTGNLKESITVTGPGETTPPYAANGGKRTAGPNQVLVTVGDTHARYGHMLEFGTVKMEAQPFVRPSWRLARTRIDRRLKAAITSAIKKAAKNA
ncbi:HK97-gp10 family putative phage morphogenesis protein [Rhizobium sp. FKL33]|uniref:HK97-gp10 family putative phage morphogenesis protein n=1 Tax=Rhizobium sp. FKL33 TaxID=2562307 RepID=UPI0010BFAD69|nr:HK97-gp10 family putative phage morphogenesis protein [Rhizobium sp. FKL33]